MTAPQLIAACGVRGVLDPVDGPVFGPINDAAHRPFGVLRIDPLPYGFRLWHDPLEALGAPNVTADETLAGLDITASGSWALDHLDVTLYRGGVKVPTAQMCVRYANVWVSLVGYPLS